MLPVGSGRKLTGVCVAAKAVQPDLRIYAAEPRDADDADQSIRAEVRIPLAAPPTLSVCDGLRPSLGRLIFPLLLPHVSGVLAVSESDVGCHRAHERAHA